MKSLYRAFIWIPALALLAVFGLVASTNVTTAQQFGSGWIGSYYDNGDLAGAPVFSRVDAQINFNFGSSSPVPGFIDPSAYSIRWTTLENIPAAGLYRFIAGSQDGIRVFLDNNLIIDNWANTGTFVIVTADVQVSAGTHEFRVEFRKVSGSGAAQFYWEPFAVGPTPTSGPTPTPTATALPPIPPGALTGTVYRASVLNVRAAPSLGGPRVGRIFRGQTYQIVGRDVDARWFLLQLSGRQAWAYGYYLFVNGNEFNAPVVSAVTAFPVPPNVPDYGVLAQTQAVMKLRASPTVGSAQTGRIDWGAFLPVIGRTAAGDWYQVVWKGTVGWVYTPYLEIVQGNIGAVPVNR